MISTTQEKPEMNTTPSDKPNDSSVRKESFGELVRKFALASVGALVLGTEEIEEFVKRLVEKGELAEKDGRTLVKDLLEKRKKATEKTGVEATPEIDRTIDRVLHKINVPTRNDLEELGKKIDEIEKKIDSLARK